MIVGILFLIWLILITIAILYYRKSLDSHIDRWLNIKEQDVRNKEYEIFTDVDIPSAKDLINDLVDDYISNYALYNFAMTDKEYIGQEDAEKMIKEVTRTMVINMIDYYLFLFKILRSITNDEELVLAVRDVVKERALMYITESNKPS